jgi:hypothetical protein
MGFINERQGLALELKLLHEPSFGEIIHYALIYLMVTPEIGFGREKF